MGFWLKTSIVLGLLTLVGIVMLWLNYFHLVALPWGYRGPVLQCPDVVNLGEQEAD